MGVNKVFTSHRKEKETRRAVVSQKVLIGRTLWGVDAACAETRYTHPYPRCTSSTCDRRRRGRQSRSRRRRAAGQDRQCKNVGMEVQCKRGRRDKGGRGEVAPETLAVTRSEDTADDLQPACGLPPERSGRASFREVSSGDGEARPPRRASTAGPLPTRGRKWWWWAKSKDRHRGRKYKARPQPGWVAACPPPRPSARGQWGDVRTRVRGGTGHQTLLDPGCTACCCRRAKAGMAWTVVWWRPAPVTHSRPG